MSEPTTIKMQSAEEMEALIAKALHRWRAADVPDSLLAKAIMMAIQCEIIKAKEQIISTLAGSFRSVGK
jgi:hypothetical protein